MAPRKTAKTAVARKASSRVRQPTEKAAGTTSDTAPQGLLPFPYEVKNKTTKQAITSYLQEEVEKHLDTNMKLQEALDRLAQLEGSEGGRVGGHGREGADGVLGAGEKVGDLREEEDDPLDQDDDEFEEDDNGMNWDTWGGIADAAQNDNLLENKVNSLARSMSMIAKGLQTVTRDVTNGFQNLAAGKKVDRLSSSPVPDKRREQTPGSSDDDSDHDSVLFSGGESDWDRLMARYDAAGEKEMDKISRGKMLPEMLYLCIPRDSEMFPDVPDEKDKLRIDGKGAYVEKSGSSAEARDATFRKLAVAIPSPLHFQHAWGWFMTLVNYRYKSAPLMCAMMQFGCEVVSYIGNYRWSDCLKMYMNLARPILRGDLDQKIKLFRNANFPLVLSKYRTTEKALSAVFAAQTGNFTTSVSATSAMFPPVFVDGVEICRKFNKGSCQVFPCPFQRKHACLACKGLNHKAHECDQRASAGTPNNGSFNARAAFTRDGPSNAVGNRAFNQQGAGPNYARASGRTV
jgi:hypothetical protein